MIDPDAWLNHLREQIPRVHESHDPASVHQMRVAAGRLSVWLELGERRILRDDLRALRRSAAHVRDLDVMLDSALESTGTVEPAGEGDALSVADSAAPLALEWMRTLREERTMHARLLASRVSEPRVKALLFGLSVSPPIAEKTARAVVQKLEKRVLAAGDRFVEKDADARALHRLRRAVRRLRYAHEWLGHDARELKDLQEELGLVNDLAVRIRHVDESAMRPLLADLRAETERRIHKSAEHVFETWRRIEARIRER